MTGPPKKTQHSPYAPDIQVGKRLMFSHCGTRKNVTLCVRLGRSSRGEFKAAADPVQAPQFCARSPSIILVPASCVEGRASRYIITVPARLPRLSVCGLPERLAPFHPSLFSCLLKPRERPAGFWNTVLPWRALFPIVFFFFFSSLFRFSFFLFEGGSIGWFLRSDSVLLVAVPRSAAAELAGFPSTLRHTPHNKHLREKVAASGMFFFCVGSLPLRHWRGYIKNKKEQERRKGTFFRGERLQLKAS